MFLAKDCKLCTLIVLLSHKAVLLALLYLQLYFGVFIYLFIYVRQLIILQYILNNVTQIKSPDYFIMSQLWYFSPQETPI